MTIHYDHKSFIINGDRVFLNSAAIHYFRMPKQEWREVLLKAKLAGMNCIDTYFAWNIHEAEEGNFYFEEDADCGQFLDLCAQLGLWVIARPGPFICAEWDFGGFPWWLSTKDGIEYRIDNEIYLKYVFRYFDQLLPIIAKRQITNGGSVILVQVENEYGYLAESERGKNYMAKLRDGILSRNIDVPLITCVGGAEDTIECANYWSGAKQHYERLAEKQPHTPKIVTEFWTGWFEHWGGMAALQKTPLLYEKRILETIAAGFDGINHYMFFGGTNFGSYGGRTVGSSDIFMITSYDYDAPLNEYGRITEKYYVAKKLSQFTSALSSFLLHAHAGDASCLQATGGLKLSVLEQEDGQRLIFAESVQDERNAYHLTVSRGVILPITIEAGQMLPVLDSIEVMQGLRITMGGYLLANESYPNRQVLILSGGKGQRLSVLLEVDGSSAGRAGNLTWSKEQHSNVRHRWLVEQKQLMLDLYLFEEAQVISLRFGEQVVELVVLNEKAAEQTWKLQDRGMDWVIGFEDITILSHGGLQGVRDQDRCPVYINEYETVMAGNTRREVINEKKLPQFTNWLTEVIELTGEMEKYYESPQGFAGLGQDFGYLLYTHQLESHTEKKTTLALTAVQDPARVFLNGVDQGIVKDIGAGSINIKLRRGENVIQFLVQHMGRLNFSPYLGEEKGIFGPVYVGAEVHDLRGGWVLDGKVCHLTQVVEINGEPNISRSFVVEGDKRVILSGVLSETVLINGSKVDMAGYANWFKFHTVDITPYIKQGENWIEMQLIQVPTQRIDLIICEEQKRLDGWSISSLKDRDNSKTKESMMQANVPDQSGAASGRPAWHRTRFQWQLDQSTPHVRLKLRLTGMNKGFFVLNGRALGRYWQIGPQEDYKLPISWLREGENELEIFDETGQLPNAVRLLFDKHSSRYWTELE